MADWSDAGGGHTGEDVDAFALRANLWLAQLGFFWFCFIWVFFVPLERYGWLLILCLIPFASGLKIFTKNIPLKFFFPWPIFVFPQILILYPQFSESFEENSSNTAPGLTFAFFLAAPVLLSILIWLSPTIWEMAKGFYRLMGRRFAVLIAAGLVVASPLIFFFLFLAFLSLAGIILVPVYLLARAGFFENIRIGVVIAFIAASSVLAYQFYRDRRWVKRATGDQ